MYQPNLYAKNSLSDWFRDVCITWYTIEHPPSPQIPPPNYRGRTAIYKHLLNKYGKSALLRHVSAVKKAMDNIEAGIVLFYHGKNGIRT